MTHKKEITRDFKLSLIHVVVFVICYKIFLLWGISKTNVRFVSITKNIPIFKLSQNEDDFLASLNFTEKTVINFNLLVDVTSIKIRVGSEYTHAYIRIIWNACFEKIK